LIFGLHIENVFANNVLETAGMSTYIFESLVLMSMLTASMFATSFATRCFSDATVIRKNNCYVIQTHARVAHEVSKLLSHFRGSRLVATG
jgi:hypothetical protein